MLTLWLCPDPISSFFSLEATTTLHEMLLGSFIVMRYDLSSNIVIGRQRMARYSIARNGPRKLRRSMSEHLICMLSCLTLICLACKKWTSMTSGKLYLSTSVAVATAMLRWAVIGFGLMQRVVVLYIWCYLLFCYCVVYMMHMLIHTLSVLMKHGPISHSAYWLEERSW